MKECRVVLTDVTLDKSLKFISNKVKLPEERKRKFKCSICLRKFFTPADLNKHKKIHKDNKDVDQSHKSKKIRSEKSNNKSGTKKVKNKQTESPKKKIELTATPIHKCETCKIDFDSMEKMRKHSTSKCKFLCGVCTRTYNTLHAFSVHILQHRISVFKTNAPPQKLFHKCSMCSESFEEYFQLKTHCILKHRVKALRPANNNGPEEQDTEPEEEISDSTEFCCELCFDMFPSQEELQDHMEFHKQLNNGNDEVHDELDADDTTETVEEPNNIPDIAVDSINTSVQIPDIETVKNESEEAQETDPKSYPIPVIESSFSLSATDNVAQPVVADTATQDQTLVEKDPGYDILKPDKFIPVDQYKCHICNRIYMALNEYNSHIEHNKCEIIRNCKVCKQTFETNSDFCTHMTNDHDHLPVCKFCFESFETVKKLDEHKLSHHLKSFKNLCKICFECFPTYQEFNTHLQKKHLNDL